MKYGEIELLLSTYSHCKDDAENCNECPWVKNKGNCDFDEEEWSLKLYEACRELVGTVENLHADISELQENNSLLDFSTEMIEDLRGALMVHREVGREQALAIYRKDVYIAELNAKLNALSSKEEEA